MEHKHTIRVVAKKTGLSPQLIRMWERRYGAVTPDRTKSGRRLYTDSDILHLSLLRQATAAGETISQVARLTDEELSELLDSNGPLTQTPAIGMPNEKSADGYINAGQRAIFDFDSASLETTLLAASTDLGQAAFLEKVLAPLLERTGESWFSGDLKIAHEHLASSVIRSLLGSMVLSQKSDRRSPLLLTTTPSGQHHELGALIASVMATSLGWRSLYLGPDLPAEEIVSSVKQKQASAVALSVVYPGDDPRLVLELKKLRRLLPDNVSLIAGGRASNALKPVLDEIGAVTVSDLADFRRRLIELRESRKVLH